MMSWDYPHIEEGFAVWLHDWNDDMPPPEAVFLNAAEAEAYIARRREAETAERNRDAAKYGEPPVDPADVFCDSYVMHVRNCFVPVWNDFDVIPAGTPDPDPVPDYARDEIVRAVGRWDEAQLVALLKHLWLHVGRYPVTQMTADQKRLWHEATGDPYAAELLARPWDGKAVAG